MMPAHRLIPGGRSDLLLVCDHASNAVPPAIDLGLPDALLADHIAWDIGAAALAEALGRRLDAPVWLGAWSRLVVDCNRPPDQAVPRTSDGHAIPGNAHLHPADLGARLALHAAFHEGLAALVAGAPLALIVSVHSFTPALASDPAPRPWPVAVLWNRDARAAGPALEALRREPGLPGPVGANEPYSGQVLNYTMDRHAEANGIPYIGFEVRQDLLASGGEVERWAGRLARAVGHALERLG